MKIKGLFLYSELLYTNVLHSKTLVNSWLYVTKVTICILNFILNYTSTMYFISAFYADILMFMITLTFDQRWNFDSFDVERTAPKVRFSFSTCVKCEESCIIHVIWKWLSKQKTKIQIGYSVLLFQVLLNCNINNSSYHLTYNLICVLFFLKIFNCTVIVRLFVFLLFKILPSNFLFPV